MQNNFGERLNYLIVNYLKTNISEFESKINVGRGVIYNAINKSRNIGLDNIQKILTHCPEINADWLLTGEGAMIEGSHTLPDNKDLDMNAKITLQSQSDIVEKLSTIIVSMTDNQKMHAKSLLQFAENDNIRAKNEQTSLEIHKKLVDLLEKK